MPSPSIPQITTQQFAEKLNSADSFLLLDVREAWELELARIDDQRLVVLPLSRLSREGLAALPASARSPHAEILVMCHQGVRSAQVAVWLASQGWTNVFSVSGGIDEYARTIDGSVGTY